MKPLKVGEIPPPFNVNDQIGKRLFKAQHCRVNYQTATVQISKRQNYFLSKVILLEDLQSNPGRENFKQSCL